MSKIKKILILILWILLICFSSVAQTNPNHVRVSGYNRRDGTYVKPYFRTAPNQTNNDNFSTKGNVNPYTGKPGWIEPDNNYNTLYYTNYVYTPTVDQSVTTTSPPIERYDDRIYVEDEHGGFSCYLKEYDERTFRIYDMDDKFILYLVINHRGDWRIFNTDGIYIKTIFLNE